MSGGATTGLDDDAATKAIEERMLSVLPSGHEVAELSEYYRLLREYPRRGGKRLRGRLLLLSSAAHGGDPRDAVGAAAALELFQDWVLIHDDIEDDSEERRGYRALHRQVGLPVALNVGDGLHVYMWQLLLGNCSDRRVVAEFLDTIHRTAEGQHLDLSWVAQGRFDVSEEEYLEMARLKTARYTVVAPLRIGALLAGADPSPLLTDAGERLGVAFQVRDDVLNLRPGRGYGKELAGDLYEGKRTLILARFFSRAEQSERDEAVSRLARSRSERTPGDVERLLELLEASGAIDYAQAFAERWAAEGMELLEEALSALPETPARHELIRTVGSIASRTR